ncbi:Co2+/Mg2+ efflux protein ApaG [Deinococcus roseus]|uniref:Protein ApaG n=1 Tax=Deinococcus roseus TaxID=392414 RepID=A0ABQ2CUB1_9DEIO|nr:Co2+/Mg2+ efflux protein ApaG [Deinococcus roseus]GGJ18044.1 protein ApaG [Deinococcus roseus]
MGVIVRVTAEFRPDASRTGLYVFSYLIWIQNLHANPIQVLERHWIIRDALGETTEVQGEGVVGLQPIIESNTHFEYSSWVQVRNVPALMQGKYLCKHQHGENFHVEIPAFTLRLPGELLN